VKVWDAIHTTVVNGETTLAAWYFGHDTPKNASIEQLLLAYNNRITFTNGVFLNPRKGVAIHKLVPDQAAQIADALRAALAPDQPGQPARLPLSYALACLCIESLFDPACMNGNLLGSNPNNDPAGYDVGIAQLKLRYLIGADAKTVDDARAFALDPTKAIPHFVARMGAALVVAEANIAELQPGSAILPQFRNPYYYATGAYNFGATGMRKVVDTATVPPVHCEQVVKFEQNFATALGTTSIFTDITG
jgi:hypothetical protein